MQETARYEHAAAPASAARDLQKQSGTQDIIQSVELPVVH
jgi:hypothetical protein